MVDYSFSRVSRFGLVNAYLVREDDGITVIDTMLPGSHKAILAAAEAFAGGPIMRIALTHAHGDHVGALDKLAQALPDAEVLISARDARLLDKDKSLDPDEPQTKIRGGIPGTKTKPTAHIAPGDRVGSLEVVAAPGHTPGHVAFRDTRDDTLFCGDAFTTLNGVATTAQFNPRFPLAAMATWNGPVELETAKALRALDPPRLAPGHGKVVENPGAAMERAIAKVAA